MFVRFSCRKDNDHQFYGSEADVTPPRCPVPGCGGPLVKGRVTKHRPKRRAGPKTKERIDLPHIHAALNARPRRQAAAVAEKRRQDDRQAMIESFRVLGMLDLDDGESDSELGDDDLVYVPGEAFKPSMRFTPADGPRFADGQRNLKTVAVDGRCTKRMADQVKASAVRCNANTKMGASAHKVSGRGIEKKHGSAYLGTHEEWNHLIADCLGGATEPYNLVAASASCNSYMLNIEACLRGKSNFGLEVTAFCSSEHVAEWIQYRIVSRKGATLQYDIDATNPCFTKDDGTELRREVMRFLHKNA